MRSLGKFYCCMDIESEPILHFLHSSLKLDFLHVHSDNYYHYKEAEVHLELKITTGPWLFSMQAFSLAGQILTHCRCFVN